MKTLRGLVFIMFLLAFFTGINFTVQAGVAEPPPDVTVFEWMTDPTTGQYSIYIDSPDSFNWYVRWFAVENPNAEGSWTSRNGWASELLSQTEFNNFLWDNSPSPFVESVTAVVKYYNSSGLNIGPDDGDDKFYWTSLEPPSHFWAGLTFEPDSTVFLTGLVHGEAANPIPEPATMLLLGSGLVGVAGAARRKKKNRA